MCMWRGIVKIGGLERKKEEIHDLSSRLLVYDQYLTPTRLLSKRPAHSYSFTPIQSSLHTTHLLRIYGIICHTVDPAAIIQRERW